MTNLNIFTKAVEDRLKGKSLIIEDVNPQQHQDQRKF